jgi:hypothetical protein
MKAKDYAGILPTMYEGLRLSPEERRAIEKKFDNLTPLYAMLDAYLDAQISKLISLADTDEKLAIFVNKTICDSCLENDEQCDYIPVERPCDYTKKFSVPILALLKLSKLQAVKEETDKMWSWCEQALDWREEEITRAVKEEREKYRQFLINIMAMIGSFSDSEYWDDIGEDGQKWFSKITDKIQQALKNEEISDRGKPD